MACGACRMGKLNRVAIRGLAVLSKGEVDSLISAPTDISVMPKEPDTGGLVAPCPAGQVRSTTGITAGICVPANNGSGNNLKDLLGTVQTFVKEKPLYALGIAFVAWKVLR